MGASAFSPSPISPDTSGSVKIARTQVDDTNYAVQPSDFLVAYATLTAARTVTLPAPSTVSKSVFLIEDETGSAAMNNITIQAAGGALIDGATSIKILNNYGFYRLYSTGTAYKTSS